MKLLNFLIVPAILISAVSVAQAVNSQITDSVTQANVKVLGEAPAESMANVYESANQSELEGVDNLIINPGEVYMLQASESEGNCQVIRYGTIMLGSGSVLMVEPGLSVMLDVGEIINKGGTIHIPAGSQLEILSNGESDNISYSGGGLLNFSRQ